MGVVVKRKIGEIWTKEIVREIGDHIFAVLRKMISD
jgi:hypothetical protein